MPAGITTTAVTETSDVADKDLVRAERVAVGAAARRLCHPLPVAVPREVAAITSSLSPRVGHPVRISVGCGTTIWGAEVI
jgi:hypothetical protein